MTEQSAIDAAPLAHGMPMLGLGTWQNTDPEECRSAVETALDETDRRFDPDWAPWNPA